MLAGALAEMAGSAMARRHRFQQWHFRDTALGPERAARVEMTARGRIERARDLAFRFGLGGDGGAMERVGNRGNQRARIRVPRILEDLLPAALLDDTAEIHHGDTVADMLDHAEIVADHDVGEPHLVLEL